MDIRKVNDTFSVCDQIVPRDIALISAMGYKSVICNRPDGEADSQPLFEELKQVADRDGLQMSYLPITPSGPTQTDAAEFAQLFKRLPKPVLAYCRSGNRSMATWKAGVDSAAR